MNQVYGFCIEICNPYRETIIYGPYPTQAEAETALEKRGWRRAIDRDKSAYLPGQSDGTSAEVRSCPMQLVHPPTPTLVRRVLAHASEVPPRVTAPRHLANPSRRGAIFFATEQGNKQKTAKYPHALISTYSKILMQRAFLAAYLLTESLKID